MKSFLKENFPGLVKIKRNIEKNIAYLNLNLRSRERIFSGYYTSNRWKDAHSRSGEGSNMEVTAALRAALPDIFQRYSIKSVVDVPCGDFFWMKNVDLSTVDYTGGDIVQPMIDDNNARYQKPNVRFRFIDLCETVPPCGDLFICRDALVHMSFKDIEKALRNIKASGSKYLFTTTFTNRTENADIATGMWRTLNFALPPFNFPPPLLSLDEKYNGQEGRYADKHMALWRLSDLTA
jgi:hypothetical protein